jgi:hypothetical protein
MGAKKNLLCELCEHTLRPLRLMFFRTRKCNSLQASSLRLPYLEKPRRMARNQGVKAECLTPEGAAR